MADRPVRIAVKPQRASLPPRKATAAPSPPQPGGAQRQLKRVAATQGG